MSIAVATSNARRRALVVNCYADETRRPVARASKIPQTLGPIFLAGGLNPDLWEIRLYNELAHGPLADGRLLAGADLVVLTGLTTAVDRMRQITAYARTANPRVVVAAGGHAVRALPSYCAGFLDYACRGDVEELRDVVADAFGAEYAADEMTPRFDLADWIGRLGYAESSRYCNFRCSFCTLTGEGRKFRPYGRAELRRQLEAAGRKKIVTFLDNNFYGNNRRSFLERVACAAEARDAGLFEGWAALVTADFFARPDNLALAREAGCVALFTGVESFDTSWTKSHDKLQNGVRPQAEVIRECLRAGVVFLYGLILDVTTRPLAELRRELEFVLSCPEITLPAYVCVPIPILGTPFFYECLDDGLILPSTRVRDLDGTTLSLRPLDPVREVARFLRDLQTMRGYRTKAIAHSVRFARNYAGTLGWERMAVALSNAALISAPLLATLPTRWGARSAARTHVSTTEPLDPTYAPALPVDARLAHLLEPTLLTCADGSVSPQIAADVEALRAARPRRNAVAVGAGG
ncbi:MAG TPA: radical SAM protein [Thermoanaerobaculaceae bacterium]|nr:radical SAM protein [Thermoanaerobaculaceae bacterium]